jgi:hypothetical protein
MKTSIRLAVLTFLPAFVATCAVAAPVAVQNAPDSLSLNAQGAVVFDGGNFNGMAVFTSLTDFSTDHWKAAKTLKPFEQQSDKTVESTAEYSLEGGAEVSLSLHAAVVRQTVEVSTKWAVQNSSKGFIQARLFIPEELGRDLIAVVLSDAKGNKSPGSTQLNLSTATEALFVRHVEEIIFNRISTGKEAFRLVFEPQADNPLVHFLPKDKDWKNDQSGAVVRVDEYPSGTNAAMVDEITSSKWKIIFAE